MKTIYSRDANGGMTLIEVLVVIACVAIVIAMLLPGFSGTHKSPMAPCMTHVRQIGIVSIMYAADNNGKFAIQISVTNGGTREFLERGQTFPHFQKLSKYLLDLPMLICPADKTRHAAQSYANLADTNLSYFLNADVSTNDPSKSIMAGDRQLQANGEAIGHGTVALQTNMDLSWIPAMHHGSGILGFADGHVQIC